MTKTETHSTTAPPATAILIAVQSQTQSDEEIQASLAELQHLLHGLGVNVGPQIVQRRQSAQGAMVFGAGKLNELRSLIEEQAATALGHIAVVFDGELSPGQQQNLAKEFEVEVLDRTQVILRVFGQRARTQAALLEIERALLEYEAPRIRDDEAIGDRQRGGGGRAGRGHTSVELRKQNLRHRLAVIRQELTTAASAQTKRRERREKIDRVALVGYTNAGKSSWMRALTGSDVLVQDALFATLDTTVRALFPATTPRIVVADTVGFLRNLPNHLLASFRSTLDEALDADLLLIVIDGSDPEWGAHRDTTLDVLAQVAADDLPQLVVVNKVDKMSPEERASLEETLPDALFVSSRAPEDITRVRDAIVRFFDARLEEAELLLPFDQAALRAEIWANARVVSEHYDENGGLLRIRADEALVARWRQRLSEVAAPNSCL
jgi:GTP-binding protein HflX